MGAQITVNIRTTGKDTQALVESIRQALEAVTGEPVNISVTENVVRVDKDPLSVYNRIQKPRRLG